ncbi:hypothetical protein ASG52_07605 [Methylobacterium sp. Leaf456]|uniref:Hint domain-containing protein n=1 Tax=Methylobacterium sp. Leaf456 TaxID=1736382 RepID=UPI0006FBDB57|nr:Hint domain-containing protein [Methylobacterium sp. Leaf456]KQT49945.1 hypothetical protein ASG52_07605 [Methylobacterium sp. Leaf456]
MTLTNASITADGTQGNGSSSTVATGRVLSDDGRYVVFQSAATNLAGTDANGTSVDIFRKDLTTGELVRVNETAAGAQPNNASGNPTISSDGRYVFFQSSGSNLTGSDTNNQNDIFRKDMTTGELVRVSVTATGAEANNFSINASSSDDGRHIVFQSNATNFTATDGNGTTTDIIHKDLTTGAVTRVNQTAAGVQSNASSTNAAISDDGRYVVFQSTATNLVGSDTNGVSDVFRKDLTTGELVRVSQTAAAGQANSGSFFATISGDGRYVVFQSNATNLAGSDGNGSLSDIFRKDLITGEVVRVNDTADGVQANNTSSNATISEDGRYIVFQSSATNLVGNDTNGTNDVFRKDMVTGELVRLSNAVDGTSSGNGQSTSASISGDGSHVAFSSSATNLVASDTNAIQDVFVTSAVCFAQGSAIRIVRDGVVREVPVEALVKGDLAMTASGAHRPIRWLGHRRIDCVHHPEPTQVRPVCIAAHAFGADRPMRDLFVSPAHAICVDVLGNVLIPAVHLVNGTTITQVEVESVTYWHVELDSHDVLLAEGLPAESYLDCGNRRFFTGENVIALDAMPDLRAEGPLPFCHPFHDDGPVVDLVRARLRERATASGWRLVADAFADLHVVADGEIIRPDKDGLSARFVVPADARAVRVVSTVSVPAHVVPGARDQRRLGVPVAALTIDDGLTGARIIAPDDGRLSRGFHPAEGDAASWRWTNGVAELPPDLWADCRGVFFLRLDLSGPALPRWVAPEVAGLLEVAPSRRRI